MRRAPAVELRWRWGWDEPEEGGRGDTHHMQSMMGKCIWYMIPSITVWVTSLCIVFPTLKVQLKTGWSLKHRCRVSLSLWFFTSFSCFQVFSRLFKYLLSSSGEQVSSEYFMDWSVYKKQTQNLSCWYNFCLNPTLGHFTFSFFFFNSMLLFIYLFILT